MGGGGEVLPIIFKGARPTRIVLLNALACKGWKPQWIKRGYVSKETVVLRRWRVLQDDLVSSTGLIMWIGHRNEIWKLTRPEGLLLETSVSNLFTVANSHYQHSWLNQIIFQWIKKQPSNDLRMRRQVCTKLGACLVHIKVAQNSFHHFPRRRFWWVIITTLYKSMRQSWYQKTAQSLVNMLVLISWHNSLP